MPKLW